MDFPVDAWLRLFVFQYCCQDGAFLILTLNSVLFGQCSFHRMNNFTYKQRFYGVELLVYLCEKKNSEFKSIVNKNEFDFVLRCSSKK